MWSDRPSDRSTQPPENVYSRLPFSSSLCPLAAPSVNASLPPLQHIFVRLRRTCSASLRFSPPALGAPTVMIGPLLEDAAVFCSSMRWGNFCWDWTYSGNRLDHSAFGSLVYYRTWWDDAALNLQIALHLFPFPFLCLLKVAVCPFRIGMILFILSIWKILVVVYSLLDICLCLFWLRFLNTIISPKKINS